MQFYNKSTFVIYQTTRTNIHCSLLYFAYYFNLSENLHVTRNNFIRPYSIRPVACNFLNHLFLNPITIHSSCRTAPQTMIGIISRQTCFATQIFYCVMQSINTNWPIQIPTSWCETLPGLKIQCLSNPILWQYWQISHENSNRTAWNVWHTVNANNLTLNIFVF